ncbi:hypothetical protein PTKIN_Ptkin04bG0041300 [Pterospermum kingtungense]
MAEDIEELCSKLSLGNDEDKDDEITLDEKWLQVNNIVGDLCLLGKMMLRKPFSLEVMKITFLKAWQVSPKLEIREVGERYMVGGKIGDVLEVEMSDRRRVWGKWIRARVVIDITKPLKKGCWLTDCPKAVALQMSNQLVLKCFDHSLWADGLKATSSLSFARGFSSPSVPLSNDQEFNLHSKQGGGAAMLHEETEDSHSIYESVVPRSATKVVVGMAGLGGKKVLQKELGTELENTDISEENLMSL